jgi:putative membrane protein
VRLLGALFFMYLDIIIDPVALQGQRWFLGRIYGYPEGGVYFGVPITNFAGWFIVGFVLIWALQVIDRLMVRLRISAFTPSHRYRYMIGPALYAGVICFNLCITLLIRDYHLLWAGIFIVLLPAVLIAVRWAVPQATAEAVDEHLRDFPQAAPIRKMIGAALE